MERLYHVIPDESYRTQALEYIEEHHQYNSNINGCGGLKSICTKLWSMARTFGRNAKLSSGWKSSARRNIYANKRIR